MAVIHAVLAVMIFIVAIPDLFEGHEGAPYVMKFERMWQKVNTDELPEFVRQPFCPLERDKFNEMTIVGDSSTEYDDVFDWFDCIKKELQADGEEGDQVWNDDTRARLYELKPSTVGEIKVWVLLFMFEIITSFFHTGLATWWKKDYDFYIARRMQPFRWIEYSITSSIMLLAIFSLSRISEVYALMGMFFCSIFLCLCGGLLFELFNYIGKVILEEEVRDLLVWLKWTFFILSWLSFLLHYVCIFDAFYTAISPYFTLPSEDLWRQLFGFIQLLNFSILGAYLSFPALHLLQISNKIEYATCEVGFMWLSLIAKGILSIVIFVASLRRRD
mgnify:CR=1 FL=1